MSDRTHDLRIHADDIAHMWHELTAASDPYTADPPDPEALPFIARMRARRLEYRQSRSDHMSQLNHIRTWAQPSESIYPEEIIRVCTLPPSIQQHPHARMADRRTVQKHDVPLTLIKMVKNHTNNVPMKPYLTSSVCVASCLKPAPRSHVLW